MRKVTVSVPDSFYKSFIEFLKHVPEVSIKDEVSENIPTWHKKILDKRLKENKLKPNSGSSWNDFEKELDDL